MSQITLENASRRENIVEQILEQGQRLRNAMVKSILDNDPFYIDVVDAKNVKNCRLMTNAFKTIEENSTCKFKTAKSARVMSAEFPDINCNCHICNIYKREIFLTDKCPHIPPLHLLDRNQSKFRLAQFTDTESDTPDCGVPSRSRDYADDKSQSVNPPEQIVKGIQDSYRSKAIGYFKYIDSMKISVHNISLNHAGNRKALTSNADSKYHLPTSISQSYFVEYKVPDCLINTLSKSNSKVDSGLTSNLFRVCSKKLQNEEIYFKHTSIQDIVNLQQLDLSTIELKFQISTRAMKQKRSNVLGYATFDMRLFEITKNMCCIEHLPIVSDDFVLGTLKITVQLGCGRLYFGKEFVDFIENNRKDSISTVTQKTDITLDTPSSQTATSVIYQPNKPNDSSKPGIKTLKPLNSSRSVPKSVIEGNIVSKEKLTDNEGFASSFGTFRSDFKNAVGNGTCLEDSQIIGSNDIFDPNHKFILYGLIYVSEAKYFEGPINSYFSCQAFSFGDTLCSRVVYNSKDPVFNFYQKVPFLYDTSFLNYLRDSSITIDFWERYEDEAIAVGTSQLSLYQFYVTYRNRVITNTLIQNRLPVTIADWWEPICSPVNGKLYGQMKVLVAIGTASQIQNLEIQRGLKNENLSVMYVPIVPAAKENEENSREPLSNKSNISIKKANCPKAKKKIIDKQITPIIDAKDNLKSVNKAVQSEENMESQNVSDEKPINSTQKDILEALLTRLMDTKPKSNLVESATNTDTNIKESDNKDSVGYQEKNVNLDNSKKNLTNPDLRKTADLLDYLNGALVFDNQVLSSDSSNTPTKDVDDSFKAHIAIEGALHLPSRRKCKLKKNKKKNITYEDSLPSTYVSFETIPGADLKYTDVVPRSTNPQWDYESDVLLPVDMLINNQKRLIFKVWRKTDTNSVQSDIETDIILGFAALDLTVLLAGLPSVQGWFNIIDFSSKCNGQIKIHVTPLENISKFSENKCTYNSQTSNEPINVKSIKSAMLEVQEPPGELLSRTLKRKFTELEEITQRLRLRLADITNDDSDTSNDAFADEFERDINSLSIEDDYDMLDLKSLSESSNFELCPFSQNENGANNFLLKKANENETSIYSKGILHRESFSKGVLSDSAYGSTQAENSKVDLNSSSCRINSREKQLITGKQHIDSLLEKLTLLAGNSEDNAFSNRYISGCSTNNDNAVPASIGSTSGESERGNGFNLDAVLKPELFNQLCSSVISPPSLTDSEDTTVINSSSNSILSQFVNYRQAPDGAGFNTSSSSNGTCFNVK